MLWLGGLSESCIIHREVSPLYHEAKHVLEPRADRLICHGTDHHAESVAETFWDLLLYCGYMKVHEQQFKLHSFSI